MRSLQRTTSKRKPAVKNIGGKRQSPRSFLPGIEFDTANAINRQSGNLERSFLNIPLTKKSNANHQFNSIIVLPMD